MTTSEHAPPASLTVEVVEAPPPRAVRSPSDLLRLVVATTTLVGVLIVGALFGDAIVAFARSLFRGIDALPSSLTNLAVTVTVLAALITLVAAAVVALTRRRYRLVLTVLAAVAVGGFLLLILDGIVEGSRPELIDTWEPVEDAVRAEYLSGLAITAAAAAVTASAPWISRRSRRIGWVLVWALALSRMVVAPVSFNTMLALVSGWVGGSLVLVVFGGPVRRPAGRDVADALVRAGVPLASLERAKVDARGSTPFLGTAPDGNGVFVKALGEDERSADILFRLWRQIVPRDLGDERPFSSLRRTVEHEALLSLVAQTSGVRTPRLLTFARTHDGAFVLATELVDGKSIDRVDPDALTDDVVAGIWEQVALLREMHIAHRDLRLANLFLSDDGSVWLIDFGFSELAAADTLLATDLAELLASLTLKVGAERAVAGGVAAVGPDALATALPRLQYFALSGATKTAMKEQDGLLEELRARVARASGRGTPSPDEVAPAT